MRHQVRALAVLLVTAFVVANDIKLLGGLPEDHQPPATRRTEAPKERSSFVRRVAREGEEFHVKPGGSVASIVVASAADVEFHGLSEGAEVSKHEKDVGARHIFKDNKEKSLKVKVTNNRQASRRDGEVEKVVILATGDSDVILETGFADGNYLVGVTMELSSCASTETGSVTLTMASIAVSSQATGQKESLDATVDGRCATASFTPTEAGDYVYEVDVQGSTADDEFERTGIITAHVVEPLGEVEEATLLTDAGDSEYVDIRISGSGSSTPGTRRVIGSAKLAGFNAGGKKSKDIAYAQHILEVVVAEGGAWTADLKMHGAWLARKGFTKSNNFEVRDLSLEDVNGYAVVAEVDSLPVDVDEGLTLPAKKNKIDDDMRMGKKPSRDQGNRRSGGKLLLVHGYCSSDVWGPQLSAGQFTNAALFLDLNQNRNHDLFATMIRDFGASWSSFGVVAHSQGGAAALHLYTYYWSGLDYASGNRLIQSVGTPYQGTALAGNIAALGSIFGAGCGSNTDLTYSGASNWLANIPSWARSAVHYSTTSFEDKWWRYDYCHLASDVLLSDPDDGTTEQWAGQLSGANNRGHKEGWCHTSSMRDPHQVTDSSRNSDMNANAAR